MVNPCGFAEPFRLAEKLAIKVAGLVMATGGPVTGGGGGSAQFRARERAAVVTACDEHLAVGQQRRRVIKACGAEAAGGTSRSRWLDRTVPRSRERVRRSSCDEHLAVGNNVAVSP